MKLSIVMPVYNEIDTIAEIVRRVEAVDLKKEVIIIDDNSTDGTAEVLNNEIKGKEDIRVIFLKKNYGKGFAIRKGLSFTTGEVVIIQDADLEYDPRDYKRLIGPIEKNKASVVYGSRFMHLNPLGYIWSWFRSWLRGKQCKIGHLYPSHFLGIQVLNFLVRLLYGVKMTDEATCYKVFRRDVLKQIRLRCKGFEFCPEVTAKVCKLGHRIYEVPISYYPRATEHGKKIKWRHGPIAIFTLLKYKFVD